jgi:thioredoxin-like negative regulator of GroEL
VDRGDEHISRGEIDDALDAYSAACELSPENDELRFWNAVTLAQTGDMDSARCVLEEIISRDRRWGVLLSRLPAAQILDAELAQDLLKK